MVEVLPVLLARVPFRVSPGFLKPQRHDTVRSRAAPLLVPPTRGLPLVRAAPGGIEVTFTDIECTPGSVAYERRYDGRLWAFWTKCYSPAVCLCKNMLCLWSQAVCFVVTVIAFQN